MFFGARCLWRQRDVGEGKSGKLLQTHRISFNGGLTQKLNYGKFLSLLYPNSTHLIFHPFDHSIFFLRLTPHPPLPTAHTKQPWWTSSRRKKSFQINFYYISSTSVQLDKDIRGFLGYFGDRSRVTCAEKCNNVFSWEMTGLDTKTFLSLIKKRNKFLLSQSGH